MNVNDRRVIAVKMLGIPVVLVTLLGPVCAGTIELAGIFADPQMHVKDGTVQGCGYRLKAIPEDFQSSKQVVLLDTSFNLYSKGPFALMKGGAVQAAPQSGAPGKPTIRPIEAFWIKVQGDRPTAPKGGTFLAAEDKGYLLYGIEVDAASRLFTAVWENKPVTIGMRLKGEAVERIYSGAITLDDRAKAQVQECMEDLIKQITAEADPPTPKSR